MRACRGWAARSVLTVGVAALAVGGLPAIMAGATDEAADPPAVVDPSPPVPEAPLSAPAPAPPPAEPARASEPVGPSQPVTVSEPAPSQPETVSDPGPSQPVTVSEPGPSQPETVTHPGPSQPVTDPDPDPAVPSQPDTVAEPRAPTPGGPSPSPGAVPPGAEAVPAQPTAAPTGARREVTDRQLGIAPSAPGHAADVPHAGVAATPEPVPAAAATAVTHSSVPAGGPLALWGSGSGAILSADWLGYLSLSGVRPSEHTLEDIPTVMMELYQAGTSVCPGLPWAVLAAVGKVETDHARNVGVSAAGARGPMQFMPATWRAFGLDADGDGRADIEDPADAVFSAASYLCANGGGAPETLPAALYAYNHAWWYVHRVMGVAQRYVAGDWDPAAPAGPVDRAALLDNPRLQLYPGGRADIAAGRIDPRVLDLLVLLTQQHEITVVSLQTGHSRNVAGTDRVSNHFLGRAVDIAAIDGERVSVTSPRARALVTWLASLEGPQRPREVGSPFADFRSQSGHFTDAMHMGHVHIGWGSHHHD